MGTIILIVVITLCTKLQFRHYWLKNKYLPEKHIQYRKYKKMSKMFFKAYQENKRSTKNNDSIEKFMEKASYFLAEINFNLFILFFEIIVVPAFAAGFLFEVINSNLGMLQIPFLVKALFYSAIIISASAIELSDWKSDYSIRCRIILDKYIPLLSEFDYLSNSDIRSEKHLKKPTFDKDFLITFITWSFLSCIILPLLLSLLSFFDKHLPPLFQLDFSSFQKHPIIILFIAIVAGLLVAFMDKELKQAKANDYSSEKNIFEKVKERFSRYSDVKYTNSVEAEKAAIQFVNRFSSKFEKMCKLLHIRFVDIVLFYDQGLVIAGVDKQDNGRYAVYLNVAKLRKFESSDRFDEILLFITAHELVHIKYGDIRRQPQKIIAAIMIVVIAVSIRVFALLQKSWIVCCLFIVIIAVTVLVCEVVADNRFVGQVKELRADRIGCKVSESKSDILSTIRSLDCTIIKIDECDNDNQKEKNGFIFSLIYGRNQIADCHPKWETRERELVERFEKRWTVFEELRYLVLYYRNKILKKGWRF